MKLYYAITSPFARKIRISAELMGMTDKLELIAVDLSLNEASYKKINPLMKVPSLKMDSGELLTNSPFICEYLNSLSLGRKILPVGPDRWPILQWQSIADGAVDAAVLRVMETRRNPQFFDPNWDRRQKSKMTNALEFLTENFSQLQCDWTLREISVACLIGYLQLRFSHEPWKDQFPRLFNWYSEALKTREEVRTTAPN